MEQVKHIDSSVKNFILTYSIERAQKAKPKSHRVGNDFLTMSTGLPLHPIWIDI